MVDGISIFGRYFKRVGIDPDLKFAEIWASGRAGAPQSDPANEEGLPSIEERNGLSNLRAKGKTMETCFFCVLFSGCTYDEENQTSIEMIQFLQIV